MSDNIVYSFGLLLISALVAGQLAYRFRLPRVTAYLLVGLLMGPQVLKVIPGEHLHQLEPFSEMAMALVLFHMGCTFSLAFFRQIFRRALKLSAGELSMTFLLVCGVMLVFQQPWPAALLFGILAMATAPATTMLVLQENDSEGPLTDYTITLVALNNLAAVVLFEVAIVAIVFLTQTTGGGPHLQLVSLARDLAVSLTLGVFGGLVVSYACELTSRTSWLVLLVALATLVLGICHILQVPYLLAFLAMGATVANASERSTAIRDELGRVTGLLCVVFFVIHGGELAVDKLVAAGAIGVAYIFARTGGKFLGIYLAADRNMSASARRWLGPALLSQAGAALALASIAEDRLPSVGADLKTIILGTVVFFEIVGPLLIRQAVLSAGEVPLDKAIRHNPTTPLLELRRLWNRLLIAFGFDPWHQRSPQDLTVADLMRKDFDVVPAAATFDQMVYVLEHSHDNVFPVVYAEGQLYGVIRYQDLRDAVFDAHLGTLVCAADLSEDAEQVLEPDSSIEEAWQLVRNSHDDLLPVVSPVTLKLVGMVARRDLYRYFLKRSQTSANEH